MIWCLHGAVGMASDWRGHGGAWAVAGEEVRRVDLWRFLACESLSLTELGAALNTEVRQAGGGKKNVLVAYSMGGRVALHALLEDPALWAGAVVVSAHPGLGCEEDSIMRMASDAEWAGKALTADWSRFLSEWNGQGVLAGVRESEGFEFGDRAKLERQRREVAMSFMEWSLGKQDNLRSRLSEIPCPILWVTGGHDEKFSALARECVDLLPQGKHEEVEDAGHRVPWDAPESFCELVTRFVNEL
jgi:2-succinyl-6-hydroxy-2,4-cyclohexadiene-1-carboxylate synthase